MWSSTCMWAPSRPSSRVSWRAIPAGHHPEHRRSDSLGRMKNCLAKPCCCTAPRAPAVQRQPCTVDRGPTCAAMPCRPGLPLTQHGSQPPRAFAAQCHRVRPGVGGYFHPSRATFWAFARPLRPGFVQNGQMQAIAPAQFHYQCHFSAIVRQSPEPTQATRLFQQCPLRPISSPAELVAGCAHRLNSHTCV